MLSALWRSICVGVVLNWRHAREWGPLVGWREVWREGRRLRRRGEMDYREPWLVSVVYLPRLYNTARPCKLDYALRSRVSHERDGHKAFCHMVPAGRKHVAWHHPCGVRIPTLYIRIFKVYIRVYTRHNIHWPGSFTWLVLQDWKICSEVPI